MRALACSLYIFKDFLIGIETKLVLVLRATLLGMMSMCHKIMFDCNNLLTQKGNLRAALRRVSMISSGDLVGAGKL